LGYKHFAPYGADIKIIKRKLSIRLLSSQAGAWEQVEKLLKQPDGTDILVCASFKDYNSC